MTLDEAKRLQPGEVLHCGPGPGDCRKQSRWLVTLNPWRVNGKVRTWKRSPSRVEVPLKNETDCYYRLREDAIPLFHRETECGVLAQ